MRPNSCIEPCLEFIDEGSSGTGIRMCGEAPCRMLIVSVERTRHWRGLDSRLCSEVASLLSVFPSTDEVFVFMSVEEIGLRESMARDTHLRVEIVSTLGLFGVYPLEHFQVHGS